jgi:hypothetical protein
MASTDLHVTDSLGVHTTTGDLSILQMVYQTQTEMFMQ